MWNSLTALWNLTFVRIVAGLANAGLNVLAARDLLDAVLQVSPGATLIAVAWLMPWQRLARPAVRHFFASHRVVVL